MPRASRGFVGYTAGPVLFENFKFKLEPGSGPIALRAGDYNGLFFVNGWKQTTRSVYQIRGVEIDAGIHPKMTAQLAGVKNLLEDVTFADPADAGIVYIHYDKGQEAPPVTVLRRVNATSGIEVKGTPADYARHGPGQVFLLEGRTIRGDWHNRHLGTETSDPADLQVYWRDYQFDNWKDTKIVLEQFDRCAYSGRASENAGGVTGATLTDPGDGSDFYVDVDSGLFYAPQDPSFVQITGVDAGRFTSWELAPSSTTYAPVLRLRFSGSSTVTINWAAQIKPWPVGLEPPY